jgi:hypothetical protein
MNAVKNPWLQRLAWSWFAMGALLALWAHVAAAFGTFGVIRTLDFDYALRLVEVAYAGRGLTPYVDFGFVYPPGQAWLYGKFLRLHDPAAINAAIDIGNLLLWSICAWQMMRLSKGLRWWLGGTILLVIGGAMPLVWGGGSWLLLEPLPLLAIALLLVVEGMERGPSRATLAALLCATAAGTIFRWDWSLGFVLLEAGWAATIWLTAGIFKSDQACLVRKMAVRVGWIALWGLAGVALALAMIFGYAAATGTLAETRLFIFYLPIHILPYRRLPLPMGIRASRHWLEAIIGITLIMLAATWDYAKTRPGNGAIYLLKGGALLAPCVALIPYAFGRADEVHLLPLNVLVILTSVVALALWPNRTGRWLLLIAIVLNVEPSLRTGIPAVTANSAKQADIHLKRVHRLTASCTSLFPSDARSLYVGQASYDRFILNSPILYLMRPDLRPASPFISDEPGIQNSCEFGSRIAAELIRAPRPLVLALDTKLWPAEPNLTGSMANCGEIEAAIARMPATVAGTCRIEDDYVAADSRVVRVMVVR